MAFYYQKILPFKYWCQKVLPAVYDDSLSYSELLYKVIEYLNEVIERVNEFGDVFVESRSLIEQLQEQMAALQDEVDRIANGDYIDLYMDSIVNGLEKVFQAMSKMVFFGLTLEGYFVAYMPESWTDIVFDTGMDYGQDTYGRLILRWDVDDSSENVNQRPEDWS